MGSACDIQVVGLVAGDLVTPILLTHDSNSACFDQQPVWVLHAGTLVGEDANQALQADINADPTTRLEAATLYRDTSGWLTEIHSRLTAQAAASAQDAQGPDDAGGQGPAGEQPRDRILEVEDGGLEGGQEGVAQEPAVVKMEENGGDIQQPSSASGSASKAESVRVKQEGAEDSMDRPTVAIFGEEIASGSSFKGEDESADPLPEQDQAGSATKTTDPAPASTQNPQSSSPDQEAPDSKGSLHQQGQSEPPLQPTALADPPTSDPTTTAEQPLQSAKLFTVLCRENGLLQIFALPEMQLLFSYTNPIEGPPLLTQGGSSPVQPAEEDGKVRVVEARMESFGLRNASGDVLFPMCP